MAAAPVRIKAPSRTNRLVCFCITVLQMSSSAAIAFNGSPAASLSRIRALRSATALPLRVFGA